MLLNTHWVIAVFEGHATREHFSYQDRETPQIYLKRVACFGTSGQNFGRCITNSSAICCSAPIIIRLQLFCEAKIDQFGVTLLVNHHIFWLQVSIDDVSGMELFNGYQNFGTKKAHPVSSTHGLPKEKIVFISKNPHQILTGKILKRKVHVVVVEECFVEFDYKIKRFRFYVLNLFGLRRILFQLEKMGRH